ncbi:MAG: DNA recombination protein RmuC [Eubacterium coprostanoligenes]|uniref:DNA recombination protein RmuC n=1 Tax=Eubacterium coprostanoligenes TaxID=290054 RepID=UPI00240A39AA|nr:DNA recombination protein RmuC [Eubacterium coprostanoligenes]MDD6665853.1 DNA recombination protein RmuC [Eubacterium coprostanoligenes]
MITYILLGICIVLLIAVIATLLTQGKKDDSAKIEELQRQLLDAVNKSNNSARIEELSRQMNDLVNKNYEQQVKVIEALNNNYNNQTKLIQSSIASMQESNEKKLEQMRATVDEKLTSTLNKRIDSSFEQVSKQLTSVYKSLGEMKDLSVGVSGLNRILTNVKTRGTWAELQLGNILEQIIPNMYETNVRTNPKYNGQVEFAVKIPNAENDEVCWLPIDSKFPMEDYIRLSESAEMGDVEAVERAQKALEARVRDEAKAIKNYISEPQTTPFAIMYLATEGLYAEIMNSKTGLPEKLQNMGILVAGPSTITALLNSLSLGFSSIAINKRANEVWKVLGNAKKQYDMFGTLLEKAKKKIDEAGRTIEDANHRNDIIQKNLKSVNTLDTDPTDIELLD